MLSKNEKYVMDYLFHKCEISGDCLVTEQEILIGVSHKTKITLNKLKEILKILTMEEYVDVTISDRQGEEVLVVSLNVKGKAFPREIIQQKRQIKYKVLLAIGGAFLSFIVGKILYLIFT